MNSVLVSKKNRKACMFLMCPGDLGFEEEWVVSDGARCWWGHRKIRYLCNLCNGAL